MSRHNPADSVSCLQRTAMNSHHPRRRALLLGGLGLPFASLTPLLAGAEVAWPNRSITLIAPNAPGGPADTLARAVANGMSKILNVPVVVENKPGASGKIGIQALLRAPRDGYTLAVTSETALSALPMFDKNVGYQSPADFEPLSLAVRTPAVWCVHPSVPANNLAELAAYSKSLPDGLTYASSGVGGSGHLATELIAIRTGAKLVHVPYKEVGRAITDTIAGHTKLLVYYAPLVPHIRAGKLKALAVLADKRVSWAPEIPTAVEQGLPGLVATGWGGLFAPAGTPDAIRDTLAAALAEALADPGVRGQLTDQGADPTSLGPAEFRRFVEGEIAKWGEVVKLSGVKME